MPTYILLGKLTAEGARNIDALVEGTRRALAAGMPPGYTIKGHYFLQGAYDQILIVDVPDGEEAIFGVLAAAELGIARTTTMRAFSAEEFERLIGGLP